LNAFRRHTLTIPKDSAISCLATCGYYKVDPVRCRQAYGPQRACDVSERATNVIEGSDDWY